MSEDQVRNKRTIPYAEREKYNGPDNADYSSCERHEEDHPAMGRDLKQLFRDAFELPEGERATLAGLLIESLEPPPDPDVEEAWAREAERRWNEIQSGAVRTIPWEEVRAKLFRRG